MTHKTDSGSVSADGETQKLIEGWDDMKISLPRDGHEAAEFLFDYGDKLADALEAQSAQIATLTAEVEGLAEALKPFYGFGSVLYAADDDDGSVTVKLYAGLPAVEKVNKYGTKYLTTPEPDDYENEIDLDELHTDGSLFGVVGGYRGIAASYVTPSLKVSDFLNACNVFLKHKARAEAAEAQINHTHIPAPEQSHDQAPVDYGTAEAKGEAG